MGYTIKAVSERTNLSPHVLRYYEREGLLPSVGRTKGGIRHYTDHDVEWLGLICCLKNTGMSIRQIRRFVELSAQGDQTLGERVDMLTEHKRQVEKEILEMHELLKKVTHKIDHFTREYDRHHSETARKQA